MDKRKITSTYEISVHLDDHGGHAGGHGGQAGGHGGHARGHGGKAKLNDSVGTRPNSTQNKKV